MKRHRTCRVPFFQTWFGAAVAVVVLALPHLGPGSHQCQPVPVEPPPPDHDPVCDDGTEPICDMVPPVCGEQELLAYQDHCYVCVNRATCAPWGQPGCRTSADCAAGEICDGCGTSSCPVCDDCVPACRPYEPQAPDCREFDYFQCGVMFWCENGVVYGEWHEHVFDEDGVEDIVGYTCETPCGGPCAAEYYEDWPDHGNEPVEALCRQP